VIAGIAERAAARRAKPKPSPLYLEFFHTEKRALAGDDVPPFVPED
jgi:hypothetical protein